MTAKPIDWTRPLRTGTGNEIDRWNSGQIGGRNCIWVHDKTDRSWPVASDGKHLNFPDSEELRVENVLSPPGIVEKWMLVDCPSDGLYLCVGRGLRSSRESINSDRSEFTKGDRLLVARVLIEVPSQ